MYMLLVRLALQASGLVKCLYTRICRIRNSEYLAFYSYLFYGHVN